MTITEESIGFLVPSKNPLCIGISGSNFCTNEGSKAFFKLIITSPNNGEHIDIVYNDVLYSIDVVNVAIDDTGWQLPTFGASGVFTFAEYADKLLELFRANPFIYDHFDVEISFINVFIPIVNYEFTAKEIGNVGLTVTAGPTSGVIVDTFLPPLPGANKILAENYTINLDLYCNRETDGTVFDKIAQLYDFPSPFDGNTFPHNNISRFQFEQYLYKAGIAHMIKNIDLALPIDDICILNYSMYRFYWSKFEKYGQPANAQQIIYEFINQPRYAFVGGVGFREFAPSGFNFLDYIAKIWGFKKERVVGKTQKDYYTTLYNSIDQPKLNVLVTFTDLSTFSFTKNPASALPLSTDPTAHYLICSPVGFEQLDLAAVELSQGKTVLEWEVQLFDTADVIRSEKVFLSLDCPDYKEYNFLFFNSMSAWDTLRCTAPLEMKLNTEGDEIEKIVPCDYTKLFAQFENPEAEVRKQFKISSGYKKSLYEVDYMQEFLKSRFVFIDINGQWRPVVINRGTVEIMKETETERNFSFQFSPANKNQNYEQWLE